MINQFDMTSSKMSGTSSINDDGDLFSKLPDDVIHEILSRVPTTYAVRTSVLSKNWQSRWTSNNNIDISDRELFIKNREEESFVYFVEKMLSRKDVISFHLSCWRKYDLCLIKKWICAVLTLNIESLKIFYAHEGLCLPLSHFDCASLRKLELDLPGTFVVAPKKCFPHLTKLYLDGVMIVCERSTEETLILEFPILKKLKFRLCRWVNVTLLEIHAPAMITFKSEISECAILDPEVKIVGSGLVKFESSGGLWENCTLTGSTTAQAALLKYGKSFDNRSYAKFGKQIRRLLEGFSGLKFFTISGGVAQAMAESKPRRPLLDFRELERLVLYSNSNAEALLELLHAAPSLKFLAVHGIDEKGYSYDYDAIRSVPSCIMSRLEEVKFNYYARTHHFLLEKFLLKNGLQLKKVYISCYEQVAKDEILQQLSTFPIGSTSLIIAGI